MKANVLETLIDVMSDEKPSNFEELHWRDVIRVAKSADVVHRLSQLVLSSDYKNEIPLRVRNIFESYNRHTQLFHNQVKYECAQLIKDIQGVKLKKLLFLKGAAYVIAGSRAATGRVFSDLDVLVDRASLSNVEKRLNLVGWIPMKRDDYDQNYYRKWAHEIPPLMHNNRKTVLNVHHNIIPPVSGRAPDMSKLMASQTVVDGRFRVLSPAAMFLHSAVHLFFKEEFVFGFRDLSDIYLLAKEQENSAGFWSELEILSNEFDFDREVYLALRYLNLIMDWEQAKKFEKAFEGGKPSAISTKIHDWIFLRILRPRHKGIRLQGTGFAYFLGFIRGHLKKMSIGILIYHIFGKSISNCKYWLTGQKRRGDLLQK